MSELDPNYNHEKNDEKLLNFWNEGGWFHAEIDKNKEPYTILIPPPNVTDRLHMGHGLNNTIQDILIRWKRMQGFNTCWLPGTDHAGISTQMMVERSLEKDGIKRTDLSRDKFFEKCVEWKNKNGSVIIDQLKKLGCSCDWQREAYTMNPALSKAVRKIFVDLFNKGLIYRGERLVNWDPVLKTAVSDDEVVNEESKGTLWYFKYLEEGSTDQGVVIATTRPETMFGDTAVAVHPDDSRYQHLIGKKVIVPFVNRPIPIIADNYVKSDFGTGCLKITPAHDPNDFELGKRHKLPFINVMTESACMNEVCTKEFSGLERLAARKLVLKKLKELGLFEKTETIKHSVPFSERSKVPIEPRLSKQWYVNMEALAKPAIAAAKSKELKFYPPTWEKTYFHWLENIQDWCISRQLWWGHRIPIWYCNQCEKVTTGMEDPKVCSHCKSEDIYQDEDVLDTWFSSWLWPISPFGWPEQTEDMDYFFPSKVLVTGPDIIYLWVARMIMASFFTKNVLPFNDVYFNAIICDKQGRKFSKTLGNGIDPLEVIKLYGADAVRYTCVSLAPLGGRVKMSSSDFENGHRFVNKLWNAAKFLLGHLRADERIVPLDHDKLNLPSKWLLTEFTCASKAINDSLSHYQINEATETLFHLAWRSFCDWGLESAKDYLTDDSYGEREQTFSTLIYVFNGIMRLAAPIIPFVTEEIWQALPHHPDWDKPESLVIAEFPNPNNSPLFTDEAEQWGTIQEIINQVRSVRTQASIPPKEKLPIFVKCDEITTKLLDKCSLWMTRLAGVETIEAGPKINRPDKCLVGTGKGWTVFVPVGDHLDFSQEKKRITNEVFRVEKIVLSLEKKLNNPQFVDKAPQKIVEKTTQQLRNMNDQLQSLRENLAAMD